VATFSLACVKWFRKVVEGRLEPDMEKGKPLDGYQYPLVFGVERVPHEARDLFVPHGDQSKHVVVLHRHQYYRVDVVSHDGKVLSQKALVKELEAIRGNKGASVDEDVGLLTTGDRAHYARSRHDMVRVSPAVNGPSFRELDSCLFVIVLEDASSDSLVERSRQFLHGTDGSNRWFDKHQVIAHADGALGMCLEHGCNDGMTWNRMLVEVWADVQGEKSGFSPITLPEVDKPIAETRQLHWDLSGKAEANLAKAAADARALVDDVDTAVLDFKEFGREKIKSWGVSPDAALQMSFQLAYARVNAGLGAPATYESCAMKPYFHGRTETIRSCTTEARQMVDAFNSPSASMEARRNALVKASTKHVAVAAGARACSGPNLGVDRHLLGMKSAALELGLPLHALFQDPAYARSNTWVLSTSNVTTPFFDLFGFGAVSGKGYGLGYMTLANSLPVNITSFVSGQTPATSSKALGKAIAQALKDFDLANRK
jgi:carnitine O-acetyltransferase